MRTSSASSWSIETCAASLNLDQLRSNLAAVYRHYRHARRKIEASCAGRARIYQCTAAGFEDELPVSVTVDDHIRVGIRREQLRRLWPAQLVSMTHVQAYLLERMFESRRKVGIIGHVAVSGDCVNRSDEPQLVQDLVAADIAGVKDDVDAGERGMDRRAEEPVRVRNQADPDHGWMLAGFVDCPIWSKARQKLAQTRSESSRTSVA